MQQFAICGRQKNRVRPTRRMKSSPPAWTVRKKIYRTGIISLFFFFLPHFRIFSSSSPPRISPSFDFHRRKIFGQFSIKGDGKINDLYINSISIYYHARATMHGKKYIGDNTFVFLLFASFSDIFLFLSLIFLFLSWIVERKFLVTSQLKENYRKIIDL